jgi:hypothetical protein
LFFDAWKMGWWSQALGHEDQSECPLTSSHLYKKSDSLL